VKIKSCDLTGTALDWAVATAEQASIEIGLRKQVLFDTHEDDPPAGVNEHDDTRWQVFNPSENWAQAGPIIERETITIDWAHRMKWEARLYVPDQEPWVMTGPTPLVAALRCFVASKLGDEADVPEELL